MSEPAGSQPTGHGGEVCPCTDREWAPSELFLLPTLLTAKSSLLGLLLGFAWSAPTNNGRQLLEQRAGGLWGERRVQRTRKNQGQPRCGSTRTLGA